MATRLQCGCAFSEQQDFIVTDNLQKKWSMLTISHYKV